MTNIHWTPEQVMELGKDFEEAFLSTLPVEKRLEGMDTATLLSHFKPEERLAGLKLEERLAGLKLEERLAGLKLEDVLAYCNMKKRDGSQ